MLSAGYVLAGGRSSRMGRDKALLPYRDTVLVDWVARQVEAAAGSATLIGPPERYRFLGRPVRADLRPGCGPLAGIETALSSTEADFNLITACDLPELTPALLSALLAEAIRRRADCLVPQPPGGNEPPLCAVWRRHCVEAVRAALDRSVRKLARLLEELPATRWPVTEPAWQVNLNTPEDYRLHLAHCRHG